MLKNKPLNLSLNWLVQVPVGGPTKPACKCMSYPTPHILAKCRSQSECSFYSGCLLPLCQTSNQCSAFLQRARGKNKSTGRTEGIPPKSLGWSSRMSSVELYMQYSRKISVHPKNYKSPFPSSSGWSWAPSATFSWMHGGGVWISGKTRAAPIQATHLHQALVPKHEGITTN